MEEPEIDFSFVTDHRLRRVLDDYYQQAQRAAAAECFLGSIVACGSVVEGLLTWALLQREAEALASAKACRDKQGEVKPLSDWTLACLIDVAENLGAIGRTAKQASWALKDFRNFIHPFNLLRQSSRPDRALAMSAVAALAEISRSLQGHLHQ